MKTQALLASLVLASLPLNAATIISDPALSNNALSLQVLRLSDAGGSLITHFTVGSSNLKVNGLGMFRSNPNDDNFDSGNLAPLTTGGQFGFTDANPMEIRIFKAATISTGGAGGTEVRAETSAGLITSTTFDSTTVVSGVSGNNSLGAFIYEASNIVLEANSTYWIATSGWSNTANQDDDFNNSNLPFQFGRRRPSQDASLEVDPTLLTLGFSTYTGNSGDKGPLGIVEFWSNQDENGGTRYTHASMDIEITNEPPTDPEDPETEPIPEPSSALLAILSLSALFFRRQRR